MKRIACITIKHETDTDPDLSFLGDFGSKFSEYYVDRRKGVLYGISGITETVPESEYEALKEDENQDISWSEDAEPPSGLAAGDRIEGEADDTKRYVTFCHREVLAVGLSRHHDRNSYEQVGGFQHLPFKPENWGHVTEDAATLKKTMPESQKKILAQNVVKECKDFRETLEIIYCCQDYERLEGYNDGHWNCIGIRAEAEVQTSIEGSKGCWLCNTLISGGLWGIESDSEKSYIEEVEEEQKAELRKILKEYGFTPAQISKAFKNVEVKEAA